MLALTASLVQTQVAPSQAQDLDVPRTKAEIVEAYIRAVERGETDAIADYLTPDFVQTELPNRMAPNGQSRGVAGMIEGARQGQAILQWQQFDIKNIVASGDLVAVETDWTGKLSVAIGEMPVGYEMKAFIAMFIQVRDGKIASQRNYDCYPPL